MRELRPPPVDAIGADGADGSYLDRVKDVASQAGANAMSGHGRMGTLEATRSPRAVEVAVPYP